MRTELAFVKVHLHSGFLEAPDDFAKNFEMFREVFALAMKDVVDVWLGSVLSHWLKYSNHSRLEDVCCWFYSHRNDATLKKSECCHDREECL